MSDIIEVRINSDDILKVVMLSDETKLPVRLLTIPAGATIEYTNLDNNGLIVRYSIPSDSECIKVMLSQ